MLVRLYNVGRKYVTQHILRQRRRVRWWILARRCVGLHVCPGTGAKYASRKSSRQRVLRERRYARQCILMQRRRVRLFLLALGRKGPRVKPCTRVKQTD